MNQFYSITTLKAEVKEDEDAFVFHPFLEPFINRLSMKFLQLVIDIESCKSIYLVSMLKAEMNLNMGLGSS